MLSYGASAEFNIMKTKLGTNQKKSNPILSNSDRIVPKSTNQSSKEEKTVVRHISEPAATKPADVVYKTTRKSVSVRGNHLSYLIILKLKVKKTEVYDAICHQYRDGVGALIESTTQTTRQVFLCSELNPFPPPIF